MALDEKFIRMPTEELDASERTANYNESPPPPPTAEELQIATDVAIFLENDLGLDIRRIRVRARGGVVYLHGGIKSLEQRCLIEEQLLAHLSSLPRPLELDVSLTVQDNDDFT